MKQCKQPCVILSDYPIKMMAYQRFLHALGEEPVYSLRCLDSSELEEFGDAKLVVCDMNVMVEFEPSTLQKLENIFPRANILFLEEDHKNMFVKFSGQRDICRLGKLAEINVIHSTLKELLLQINREEKKSRVRQKGTANISG